MKFSGYIESLLPSFSKSRLVRDLNDLKYELSETTIPPLRSIVETISVRDWKSQWVKNLDSDFRERAPIRYKGIFFTGVLEVLMRMEKNIPTIDSLIQEYYADNILKEAMTVMRINILQYLETMRFVTQYARRMCNMALILELDMHANATPNGTGSYNQGEMDWLMVRREDFFTGIGIVSSDHKQLDDIFKMIPEVVVNGGNVDTIIATQGISKIDPFGFGLISAKLNPLYHIGLAIAEWQAGRLAAAKAERQALEFKLTALKQLANSQSSKGMAVDTKLQERINYTQKQVEELNYALKKMEDKYGTA